MRKPYDLLKRMLDIIGAAVLIVMLTPVFLILNGLVKTKLGSPVLFSQARPGRQGKLFTMYKYRTMSQLTDEYCSSGREADVQAAKTEDCKRCDYAEVATNDCANQSGEHKRSAVDDVSTDESRLTPCGRMLRSTSLDELPELFNILRGDMSFVGPRPFLPEYLSLYNKRQARRHEVRPGLTGLAQVSGRNQLSWPDRLELDVQYVETRSLWLDVSIMWRTVTTVFTRSGVTSKTAPTMEPFHGEE